MAESAHAPPAPANILLVDDRPANLLALEVVLADLGANLVRATSGEEALRLLAAERYAVVLLDVVMPGLNGFETAQRIRASDKTRHTPIIFISATEYDEFPLAEAYRLGAVDYLVKPLIPDVLRAKVGAFVDLFWTSERLQKLERRERERAEEALRETEQRFARFMDHLPGMAWIKDVDGRYLYINEAVVKLVGRPREEVYGLTDEQLFPPDQASELRANDRRALESANGVQSIESLLYKDGSTHHSLVSKFAIPGPDGSATLVGGVAIDMTERRQAEEALRASEERYRALVKATSQVVWSLNPSALSGDFANVQLWWERVTGQTLEEQRQSALAWLDVVHPDDLDRVSTAWTESLKTGTAYDLEYRVRGRTGGWRIIHARGIPVPAAMGESREWVGTLDDITEVRQAEETRERLAAIVASSEDAVISKSLDGVIQTWNVGAERLFGYTAAEAVGKPITLIIPPERLDEEKSIIERMTRGERVEPYETIRAGKNGRRIDVSVAVSPLRDATGRVIGASKVARDITERKRAETARRFLTDAAEVLASSLDYETTLTSVARLIVPRMADWCSVYMAEAGGALRQLAVAHADPDKVIWAKELAKRYPPDPNDPGGMPAVVRTGEPYIVTEVTDEMIDRSARDPEHLEIVRSLGVRSVMIVPLAARGRTLGAITFVAAESGRRFTQADFDLAIDLGRRAGLAVDNARLFRESQESLRLLSLLVEASGRLTGLLDPAAVRVAVLDLSNRLIAADAYAIWRYVPEGPEWRIADSAGLSPAFVESQGHVPGEGSGIPEKAIVAEDVRNSTPLHFRRHAYVAEGIASIVAAPLRTHGRVTGTLVFYYRTPRHFDEVTVRVASALADLAGSALGAADLYSRESESRRRAEEADRRKDEFLAVLAHELRNPLAPIRNSLQILHLRGSNPGTTERVREMMERQVKHLCRLVDDLLDASRITTGKVRLNVERLNLATIARQAAVDHRPAFEAKQVVLNLRIEEPAPWVNGDATRLAQVLDNLLGNSLKFTPRGGEVTLSVAKSAQGQAALVVSDTGAGIEAEVLPRLFEPFAQADRTLDRSGGGLGLGLAIVKGLISLHGGAIRAESAGLGKGSTFTVTLPIQTAARADVIGKSPQSKPSNGLRILVVEDNRDAAESLRLLLEAYGYEVQVAYTGTDGVSTAQSYRPDVILCDIGLPGLDGYGVAAALRQNPSTASTRLIALTGYGQEEDRRKAREAGFDEHLTKPADPVTLESVLAGVRKG
jgi:PAS domain S-box-containing protein